MGHSGPQRSTATPARPAPDAVPLLPLLTGTRGRPQASVGFSNQEAYMPNICFSYPADVPPEITVGGAAQPGLRDPRRMPAMCFSYQADVPRSMPLSCFSYSAAAP